MIPHLPFIITARLLPGLKVGDGYIHIEYSKQTGLESRTRYHWTIDLPDNQEFTGDDLQSGNHGGTDLQYGMGNLLSFLSAAAESHAYGIHTKQLGENEDLFPKPVVEWAYQNADEIQMLQMEIEKSETKLIEE